MGGAGTTRFFLVDDHETFRLGLRSVIESNPANRVVAEASSVREAVRRLDETPFDVLVVDLTMPGANGLAMIREMRRQRRRERVLVVSMHADEVYVTRALKAGAHGYLLKDSAGTDLLRAVSALAQHKSFFSPSVSRVMLDDYVRQLAERGITDRYDTLSEREREVFQLIAEGRVNKEIAEILHLSPSTVETHRARIMEKLDVHSAVEIVLYAVRKGIIT